MTTPLPTRPLGRFTVSSVGLGCMNLSHGYGNVPDEAGAIRLIHHALDAGITFFDTASVYGGGRNERLVGKALGNRRGAVTLASKCVLGVAADGKRFLDGRPETITRMVDASLERLGTDHIDLYYLHRLDKAVPIEDSVGALARAVEAGKIGAIGLSEMSASTIARAHAVHPVTAVQSEYSLWVRNPEVAVLERCKELGIAFVAFSPVGRAMLTGALRASNFAGDDIRAGMPRFLEPHFTHNLALVDRFVALARANGMSAAQLCIAWLLSRWEGIIPIPGTCSIAHLDDDIGGVHVAASPALLAQADALFAPGAISGRRYSPALQASIDTELLPEEI